MHPLHVCSACSRTNSPQGLHKEGVGRCDALKSKGLTWNAVKSFFKVQYPEIFQSFNSIKSPHDEELNDLHRARSGDGGYAFEYWCTGGDINDIEGFRDYVKSMLEACGPPSVSSTSESSLSVPDQIRGDNSRAMSTHESVHHNVWALSLAEREQLITKWKAELGPYAAVDKLVEVHRRFCIVKDMQRQAQLNIDARLIKDKQIIGVTTTACAQDWSMLEGLNLSTVICEEAGEITEAQTLTTLLPSIKHAIFIGDPDQLRPQLNQPSLSMATETGRLYRLDESLFERMVSPRSPEVNALPYSTLSVQRRMHPDIADLMRATEYPFLKDHASTARPPVAGMVHRTFWFDHQHPEDRVETLALDSTSYSNAYECDMICEMVRHLLKTYVTSLTPTPNFQLKRYNRNDFGREDITILCPYNKQLANIRAKLTKASKCSIFLSDTDKEYLVDTRALPEEELRSSSRSSVDLASMVRLASVDGFQGQESKVVILSAVRSNPQDRTGFLSITNRINVACSRARNGFYILGNSNLLKTVPMWEAIINDFERKGRLGTSFQLHCSRHPNQISAVGIPNDFGKALDCEMRCSYILNCGHQCPEKCHKPELHPRIRCGRPCWKRHPGCGSQCTNQCGEPCNTCETTLSKSILSCGHEYSITCTGAQQRTCEAILETIVLSCGHAVERTCSKQDQFPDCQDRCSFILDCGHQCSGKCSECRINNSHAKCTAVCGRRLGCDHTCATKCHKGTCPPCQVRCKTFCEHGACSNVCGMICVPCVKGCLKSSCIHGGCTTICCLPCQDLPCNQPCTQLLPCSHVCPGLCGEECCTDCLECETGTCPTDTKMFLSCGHVFNVADLDTKFNLRHLFEINDDGSIEDFRRLSKREDIEVPQCPQCGTIVTNRRYSIFQQLIDEPNTIDRIYNMLGQKLRGFMLSLQDQKKSLEQGVNGFLNELKQGPLVGKTNGELIKSRVAMILPLRTELNKFRGNVSPV